MSKAYFNRLGNKCDIELPINIPGFEGTVPLDLGRTYFSGELPPEEIEVFLTEGMLRPILEQLRENPHFDPRFIRHYRMGGLQGRMYFEPTVQGSAER